MVGDVLVGIILSFSTNGIGTMDRLNAATRSANASLERSLGLTNAQTAAWNRHALAMCRRVATRYREMRAMVAGGIAVAGGAAMIAGIDQAAKFQLAMTSVGLTTNSSLSQMARLQQLALHTSGITAQSATTTAQEMATAAQAGLGSYGRISTLFPLLAKFADVQYFQAKARGRSFAPTEAMNYGVQFAHLFQAYTPGTMTKMLEWITKLTTVTSEAPQRALMQAKFAPLGKSLGLGEGQIFELLATMGQTGFLRARGGMALGRVLLGAINATTLTGHLQAAQGKALRDLGLISATGKSLIETAKGALNWAKFNSLLASADSRLKPDQYARDCTSLSGS